MTNLYLYRHGQTEENIRHILQGHMPGTLSEEGKQQTIESAPAVEALGIDVVLVSDLKRCTDTYELLSQHIQSLPPMITTKLLRERGWGSATGIIVDGKKRITIPDDAESVKALRNRAKIFIDYVQSTYHGKNVLAISHGLFCRFIQSVFYKKDIPDIIPMKNNEIRKINLTTPPMPIR